MNPGFHTASFLLHDETTLVHELAKIGYRSIVIQPRLGGLHPCEPHFTERILRFTDTCKKVGMQLVFEIDGSFLFDPRIAAGPSLASTNEEQGDQAIKWAKTWIDLVAENGWSGSNMVTFRSGAAEAADTADPEIWLEPLGRRITALLDYAANRSQAVRLALCPKSDNAIAKVSHFERLTHWLGSDHGLFLAADIADMYLGGGISGSRAIESPPRQTRLCLSNATKLQRYCDKSSGTN